MRRKNTNEKKIKNIESKIYAKEGEELQIKRKTNEEELQKSLERRGKEVETYTVSEQQREKVSRRTIQKE